MPLRIVANRPDPAVFTLPWPVPLVEWTEHVISLPRGLSRHVVRIVRLGEAVYAVKETVEPIAWREYGLLRDLQRMGLPAVTPHGVVAGRETESGEPLPACLITRHLAFAMPYRTLFSHGVRADSLPLIIDALVVLLVRLHLAGFYWGDVSLSNVLFRRNAGAFAAYLVDAETGELRPELSAQLRNNDVQVGVENVFAELLDLKAGGLVDHEIDEMLIVDLIQERYASLWEELTAKEEFDSEETWRIEQRVERLNDLGFDVEELDVVTDWDGSTIQIQPRVVELGHHRREFRDLTGLDVEDNQARRLLNDLAAYTAYFGLGGEDRMLVANRWLSQVYEPTLAMIPPEQRGKLEGPELFHEILEHRWYLSEDRGAEVSLEDTAQDYIDHVLPTRPEEVVVSATAVDDADALLPQPE
ncbi:DUF4032 domain-containing protein [Nocardioides mangrovicus]|uniref:DUF4032 domain-containing protein n=1 Tax=Nocardioides mangrovicus TaxID=2478913 RepID=A0A3L8NXC6_9ACTN|nr:DUF4032 domain-containing protein [Nocardioides mangrovicus]RLV47584.1 DUF4032 domain-containing protein [Nocardioides mangrovicus]